MQRCVGNRVQNERNRARRIAYERSVECVTLPKPTSESSPSAGDIRITGSGRAAAGRYRRVHVVGDATFDGPVTCEELHVTGSMRAHGELTCGRLQLRGELRADGDVRAEEAHVFGLIRVQGSLEGERLKLRGAAEVDGLLSADELFIRAHGPIRATEIGGGHIDIRSHGWFSRRVDVNAEAIEGDDVQLRSIRTSVVRGRTVTIGRDCEVQRVEYSAHVDISPRAKVQEVVQR